MQPVVLALAALLLLAGCGDKAPPPADASVTFSFREAEGGTPGVAEEPFTTVLVAEKPGTKTIVDAWAKDAPAGTICGRHNFPPGTTAAAVAAYYEGLLANAGWTDRDFRAEPATATLRLFGVTRIESRADGGDLAASVVLTARR